MSKTLKNTFTSFFLIILILAQSLPSEAKDKIENTDVIVLSTSNNSITFKVTVPVEDVIVEEKEVENETYSYIQIPGWSAISQANAPQLPFLTEVLGVPFDAEIKINVIPGKAKRQKLEAPIVPVVSEKVDWGVAALSEGLWNDPVVENLINPDLEIYQSSTKFPGELSKLTNDAVLRQQRLISLALFPIQYDPAANEIIIYDSLIVEVSFLGSFTENLEIQKAESPVYEKFYRDNLLNYDQARVWRKELSTNSLNNETISLVTPWLPPDPGWRIRVREAGFYKITFAELTSAGVPIDSIEVNTLKMFHLGEEIAIKVLPGEAVIFYGESIESKYTADNVYWLTYGGQPGLRIESLDGPPTGTPVPTSFISQEHLEQDHLYRSKVPGADDFDRFMWDYVYRNNATANTWTYNFSLDNRYDGAFFLNISLIGYLQQIPIYPDHRAEISINDTVVSDVTWDGFLPLLVELEIPESLLLPDINTLKITALPTEFSQDLFFIDWLDFEYNRTFKAELGQLRLSYQTPGDWQFVLTDFTVNTIDIFDISTPSAPKWIENVQVTGENADFSAIFHDQVDGLKEYFALSENNYLNVLGIDMDTPSNLYSELNGADYLMISHQDFIGAAASLQTQKEGQGLRTQLIDIQDIYDEFGYGIADVYAIRNFIAYAYDHWVDPDPAYVLLIGDGHFDPKNNLGYGRTSFISPFLANCDPEIGETAADNRYVSIVGDDVLPDLMIGRLSVNTLIEAQSIINKIIAYESNPPEGDWHRQILAVADNLEPGAHYPLLSESLLQDYFPSEPFEAAKVYWMWTHTVLSEARADIQNAFNEGKFLVNYIGHAYYSGWANEGLFTTNDIGNLQPQEKLPVILAMTCMEGYYISPNLYSSGWEAMGEVITRTDGKGAVASWSPTGWGNVYGHDALDRGFFRAIYQEGINLISQATNSGLLNLWATGNNLDLLDTYLLFGDPAMQLHLSLTAVRDNYSVYEDEMLSVTAEEGVLMNDINPDNDPLTVILVQNTFEGSLSLSADGSFVYTPDPGFYGSDAFSYKLSNGLIDSNTVLVQIYVNSANAVFLPLISN